MNQIVTQTDAVLLRQDNAYIATLTLNRPQARNALSVELMTALEHEIEAIAHDKSVRVVVLAGNGPAFCAGHDLREIRAKPGRTEYTSLFSQCARLMLAITERLILDE